MTSWYGRLAGACLLAGSLAACGSDSGAEAGESSASLGCSDGTLDSSVTHIDLEHDGASRSYEIYVPSTYDGSTAVPVVLNFHGFTSSGIGQQENTQMDETAAREGFIVVYPNGLDNSWNAGVCCGRSAETNVDDVGFTRAVVEDLGARGCIDTARVYATGMSNGGFLSHRLACEADLMIAGWHEEPRPAVDHHLADAAHIGRDDGESHAVALDVDIAECLVEARGHLQGRRRQPLVYGIYRNGPRESAHPADSERIGQLLAPSAHRAVADELHRDIRTGLLDADERV